jgi:hypothetical protein
VRLYLDFDGVLHRFMAFPDQSTAEKTGLYRVCQDGGKLFWTDKHFEHVPKLAALLEAFPDVEIYAHTSWRYLFKEQRPDDIVEWLGPLGARFVRFVPSSIRGSRHDVIRGDMYHDKYKGPWLAVDDEDDGFSFAGAHSNFVHTDSRQGLNDRAMNELRVKLEALRCTS